MKRVIENNTPASPAKAAVAPRGLGLLAAALLSLGAVVGGGCDSPLDDLNMQNTPRNEPGEPSDFFADGKADRNQIPGTVAQGQLVTDQNRLLQTGLVDGKPATTYPFEMTKADLELGRLRYEIFCAVCHNSTGDGKGMIVQRGFVPPPSLHDQRLKDAAPGHFFSVISNGWGAMYSYNDRISVEDRWRIAAYVKVLQLSQGAEVATLPPDAREAVQNADNPNFKQPAPVSHEGEAKTSQQTAPAGQGAGHE